MKHRAFTILCIIGFIAYLILLIKLIVLKYPDAMTYEILRHWSLDGLMRHIKTSNIIPFKTIASSLFNSPLSFMVTILLYNIGAFVPLGFLLPCIRKNARKWWVVLIVGLLLSLVIEVIQLITLLGEADIDDVILNVTGTVIGYGLYKLVSALPDQIRPAP